jgi:hypothetical protein
MTKDLGWRQQQFETQWVKCNTQGIIEERAAWITDMWQALQWCTAGGGECVSVDEMAFNTRQLTGGGQSRGAAPPGMPFTNLEMPQEKGVMIVNAMGRSEFHQVWAVDGSISAMDYVLYMTSLFNALDEKRKACIGPSEWVCS